MDVLALHPVGARVTGVSVSELTAADIEALKDLLARHGVLVLTDQPTDDDTFVAFLRRFGELTFTVGETPVPGCPELNVVSNAGRATPPRSTFHVDTSYVRRPPAYTALRAVKIPERGGETLFTNQYRAYDTLPPELRAQLHGREITHVATGVTLGDTEERAAEHPALYRHPRCGRTAVYISAPARCVAITGMSDSEATETVTRLFAHCTQEENVHRHPWAPDDLVIWDNRCVLHRADHADVSGERTLHRGLVLGEA